MYTLSATKKIKYKVLFRECERNIVALINARYSMLLCLVIPLAMQQIFKQYGLRIAENFYVLNFHLLYSFHSVPLVQVGEK